MVWLSRRMLVEAVAVRYEDDPVLHERLLLWPYRGSVWDIRTPDGKEYREDLLGGYAGPSESYRLHHRRRLGHGVRAHIYRFREWPGDGELRGMRGTETVDFVRNSEGEVVDVEDFLGGRRPPVRRPVAPRPLVDTRGAGLQLDRDGKLIDPTTGEEVRKAGTELAGDSVVYKGSSRGVACVGGIGEVAVRRRDARGVGEGACAGEEGRPRRQEPAGGPQSESVDARILPVVFDDQGERALQAVARRDPAAGGRRVCRLACGRAREQGCGS